MSERQSDSDPVVGFARVMYAIPIRHSDVMAWSKPGPSADDPEDDAWIFEVQEAVLDRLPDLLERAGVAEVGVRVTLPLRANSGSALVAPRDKEQS